MQRPWKDLLAVLVLFSTLSSCSKFLDNFSRLPKTTTRVAFSVAQQHPFLSPAATVMNGGHMIYLQAVDGSFSQSIYLSPTEVDSRRVPIPPGDYEVFAVGFAGTDMTTSAHCGTPGGSTNPIVKIEGTAMTVDLELTRAGCANLTNAFSLSGDLINGSTGFKPMHFVSCATGTDLSGITYASADCSSLSLRGTLHHLRSMQLSLVEHLNGAISDIPITTGCIPGSGAPDFTGSLTLATYDYVPAMLTTSAGRVFASILRTSDSAYRLFYSDDDGGSFTEVTGTFPSTGATAMAESDSGKLFLIGSSGGLYSSSDDGLNWSLVSGTSGHGASYSTQLAASDTNVAYINDSSSGVFLSVDDGATFTSVTPPTFTSGRSFANLQTVTLDVDGTLFVTGQANSPNKPMVAKRDPDGTWTEVAFLSVFPSPVSPTDFLITDEGNYVLTTGGLGLVVSTDEGASWDRYCTTGCTNPGLASDEFTGRLVVADNVIYGALPSGGIQYLYPADLSSSLSNGSYTGTELGSDFATASVAYSGGRLLQGVSLAGSGTVVKRRGSAGSGQALGGGTTIVPALPVPMLFQEFADPVCTDEASRASLFEGPLKQPSETTSKLVFDNDSYVTLFVNSQ